MAIFRYPNWRWPDLPGALEDFERARRQMDRLLSVFSGGAESRRLRACSRRSSLLKTNKYLRGG